MMAQNSDFFPERTVCGKTGPDSVGAHSATAVCFVGWGLRLVHTLLQECSWLETVRVNFNQLSAILSCKKTLNVVIETMTIIG